MKNRGGRRTKKWEDWNNGMMEYWKNGRME